MNNLPFSETYCGPAPSPETLLARWNFDPLLIAVLALTGAAFLVLRRDASRRDLLAFGGGWVVLAIAFVSPLCALTVALFSARVAHHVLLVAVAAPLLALGLRGGSPRWLTAAFILHTAVFWVWHVPDIYAAALASDPVYWVMQASLLGSAVLMWRAIFTAPAGAAAGVLLGSVVQMGLLGALLTFAPRALYLPHLATTEAFGLSPLADQQLAGAAMWVLGSLPYLGVALWLLVSVLGPRRADAR